MILKLSELRVAAFAQFARKWKDHCDFVDIAYQKLISHSVTRWLSFTFILHVHRQTNCCSESFLDSLSELCLTH